MMDDIPNDFTLIGLHKLAAERGDGLVPELLALYSARRTLAEAVPPILDPPAKPKHDTSVKSAGNDNVIPLQPYLQARKRR
jgi:hypothetical protein